MKKFILIIFLAFSISSCQCLLLKTFAVTKSALKHKRVMVKGDREIIYIPMAHLGKQAYYDEVKAFVTEKRKQGYKIYYEAVLTDTVALRKGQLDTLRLKRRKLLGFHLSNYSDENNKSMPKCYKKYVGQTLDNTGVSQRTDTNADLRFEEIIARYEATYGEIPLDECDYSTPLNAPYQCNPILGKRRSNSRYGFTQEFRNKHLKQLLVNSEDKKILLLYGESHWLQAIWPALRDEGFQLVEGKI
ncbi:hypothetical protein [Capnocytophaga cynodegmi]|uniref:Lipoprotein n=1 Tax=Capnocytophaga cynodegmi TaxID=28189 RepID=A0A0B7HFH8_9FLAO|nr:hypothetical protein [Capnocytophaga cynodegmi]CEN35077.1 conserved exported hypothetical protein [Capnocytophaga cynodegmi]CEN38471.1 conserved exported hypothetical protein [Capnocytophaga cynodegmi]